MLVSASKSVVAEIPEGMKEYNALKDVFSIDIGKNCVSNIT